MQGSPVETEVKIRLGDEANSLARLLELGFREHAPRSFEANTLYDTADNKLRNSGMLLRLREFAGYALLTWKGVSIPGPHKSRPEIETRVESAASLAAIFTHLEYVPTFRYEKYRTEFLQDDGSGLVTLDETPIGWFLELEGQPEWIDATALALGFGPRDYVLESYGKLYLDWCEANSIVPSHMTFDTGERTAKTSLPLK